MESTNNNKRVLPLLVLVLLVLSYFLYNSTIQLFPSFVHAWTQSDRYAIALRFLDNGFDLFHPATFNLQTVNGITRVDFPINEFFVAILMKITGTTAPIIFRMYTLCVSIGGLIFLYLLTKKITGSEIKASLLVLFVFLSPVYVYYQAGFIPSVPAIAAVFAGYYYFFSYKESQRKKQFYAAVFFFLLAALMRFPFIVFLFAVVLQQGFMFLKEKQFKRSEFFIFIFAFFIFIGYYVYNIHLGRIYGNMFLDNLMPAKNFAEFREILSQMYYQWAFHYFTPWHYLILFIALLLSVLTFYRRKGFKEEDKKYWFQFLIISCGTTIYFLLMVRQFYAHDYYFLDSLFIPIVLLFLFTIKNIPVSTPKQKISWAISSAAVVCLSFISTKSTQAERYSSGPWDRTEITRENFTGAAQYLDSTGIPKDAKILVIDAYTTNAPLILMNRKGYTVMGTTAKNISMALYWAKWDYVAIQDNYLVSDVIKNYPPLMSMLECVGGNGGVSFYKRSKTTEQRSLKEFLGITPERTYFKFSAYNDANTKQQGILDAATEYGATASAKASGLKSTKNLKVLVTANFIADSSLKDLQLVASISTGDQQLFYQNFILGDYFKPSPSTQKMEFQFVLPAFKTPDDELKVYLWNPGKQSMVYDSWEVVVYK